jgi:hypothetical protein
MFASATMLQVSATIKSAVVVVHCNTNVQVILSYQGRKQQHHMGYHIVKGFPEIRRIASASLPILWNCRNSKM